MKSYPQSAEDDLPFFGAVKNLFYISKVDFALDVYASASTKGKLWAPTHRRFGAWLMLADS